MTNIFEVALRKKFRFNFRGMVTVEDLWDLKLSDLDIIYKDLKAQAKQAQEDSLLNVKTAANQTLDAKIEIVEHIFNTKQEEALNRENAKKKAEDKKYLAELLERKQKASLESLSEDELKELINKMD